MLDRETMTAYEVGAEVYEARGTPPDPEAGALAARAEGVVLDLGCGTGRELGLLDDVVGVDPSAAMLRRARANHPATPLVRAVAGALPFRPRSLGGAWAGKSLQHVAAEHLPLALADLHRAMAVGAPLAVTAFAGEGELRSDGDLPGRHFTLWTPERLAELAEGAGFIDVDVRTEERPELWTKLRLTARRGRTLADTVGPGLRLLACGLNPSLHAADAGVGYAGPGNRFWPALAAAGLAPGVDRDPWALLAAGIGMTDLVKRATPRAADLRRDEYRHGLGRLERLCTLLRPGAVVMVGLAGWRAATHRSAGPGWQERRLGPSPVYVMPSTSGLNAAVGLPELTAHLEAAADGRP